MPTKPTPPPGAPTVGNAPKAPIIPPPVTRVSRPPTIPGAPRSLPPPPTPAREELVFEDDDGDEDEATSTTITITGDDMIAILHQETAALLGVPLSFVPGDGDDPMGENPPPSAAPLPAQRLADQISAATAPRETPPPIPLPKSGKATPPAPTMGKLSTPPPPPPPTPMNIRRMPSLKGAFPLVRGHKSAEKFMALYYGPAGVGKTLLAGTCYDVPAMRDVFFINVEAGTRSIDHYDQIVSVPLVAWTDIDPIMEFLSTHARLRQTNDITGIAKLQARLNGEDEDNPPANPFIFKTVVLDSLSEAYPLCMQHVKREQPSITPLSAEASETEGKEWGAASDKVLELIRRLRALEDTHVIVISGEQRKEDDLKRFIAQPSLPGKLGDRVMYAFDMVGYFAKLPGLAGKPATRRLHFEDGSTIFGLHKAKNRWGAAMPTNGYLDNPTMADLYAIQTNTTRGVQP